MALILRKAAAAAAHRLLAAGARQSCVPALCRGMASTSPGNRNVALLEMGEPGLLPGNAGKRLWLFGTAG